MNGEGSYMAPEVVVVGKQYTAPNQVDLTIVRKMMSISRGNFGVTDTNGNIMFKVKGKVMSLRTRRVLLDAAGTPIVSFQKKIMSMHSTWKVYRGDSNDSKDLLFTVRKSSLFQFKTQLDVFLASNTSKDNRDFKIKGSWFEKSCTIYAGNSSTVIAQMHKKHSFSSFVLGKDKFAVTVYPHVDYAFITALVVILEEINEEGKNNGGGGSNFGGASGGGGGGGGGCGGGAS
ncbi:hypothetical protein POM88_054225 [Heracleum sosnowskyi]|uniref:Uncharacterized protein n=1 Tax=Heracleum sosnowskyi TaxID=360622 RepID=A0AAD8GP39_9APIA|nr:hypothetical protein POM88_054225 [Heracleum sosnowskyi]